MEITTETDLLKALSECPEKIVSIYIKLQSKEEQSIFIFKNCINLISITIFPNPRYKIDYIDLKDCINLNNIYITHFNSLLDLSNCTNLNSINLPQYDYTINLSEFKNLNNIILSPINNSFNMIYFKKINKLEDTISQLVEKLEHLTQNKSYFT